MRNIGRRRGNVRGGASDTLPFRITGVTPASVTAGAGATAIDVAGIGFPGSAVIYIDGVAQTTNRVSQFLLQCTVASGVTAVPGFKSIQVIDALGQESNIWQWPVSFPVPSLSTLTPAFGYLGTGAANVSASGTGFYNPGTTAAADGSSAPFTYGSSTTGTVQVPSSILNVAGDHAVTLSNPVPGGGISSSQLFQTRYKAPAITGVSPTTIPINNGDTNVTITDSGGNFYNPSAWPDGGTQGYVDGVAVATTYLSPTQVRIVVPASVTSVPGTKVLTVSNPTIGGGGGTSAGSNISVSAPSTSALSFASRPQFFDPYTVRITGTNFVNTDVARWQGQSLATTFINATTLDAVLPKELLANAGTFPITVRTLAGYDTNGQNFTVLPWAVTDAGSTIRLWQKGSSLVDDGAGRASQWNDLSGGNRHFPAASSGQRALISTHNGQPAAYLDGNRVDLFTYPNWIISGSTGLITTSSYDIFIAGAALGSAQVSPNAAPIGEPGPSINCACLQPGGLRGQDASSLITDTFGWTTGATFVFHQWKIGSDFYTQSNRQTISGPVTSGTAYTPTTVYIGRGRSGSAQYTGYIDEIIIASAVLNFTVKHQIENRLGVLYGATMAAPGTVATVSSVSPNTGTQFDVPFMITVNGSGFTNGDVINCDAEPLVTTFVNSGQMTAMLTATSLATYGVKGITVSNAGGHSAPVALTIAQYIPGAGPNLNTISPTTKEQYKNAFTLTCNGSNFTATSVVYIGATALVTTFVNSGQLTATVPANITYTSGNKNVTVVDTSGTSSPQVLSITARTLANLRGASALWEADSVNTTGSTVTQWNEKFGTGRHCSQATGTRQGTLNASDANFNGNPSVNLDGNDDYVCNTAISSMAPTSNWILAVVYRADTITGNQGTGNPAGNNNVVGLSNGSFMGYSLRTGPLGYGYTNDGTPKVAQNSGAAVTTTQQAVVAKGAGQIDCYVNGVIGTTVAGVGNSGFSSQFLTIGSCVGGNFFDGQVGTVFLGNQLWFADDFELWNNFCTAKYAIL